MKYHVYISPSELFRQLSTVVDLPTDAIELPNKELEEIIRMAIAPITQTKTSLFKEYSVDGLREVGEMGELPTPAWLLSPETENAITGYHPMLGTEREFLWTEFLAGVLQGQWMKENEWRLNEKNLGYPVLKVAQQASLDATFGQSKIKLRGHLPSQWIVASSGDRFSQMNATPLGVVMAPMQKFLEITPGIGQVFPARTNPLFYVALYEFWQYLAKEPAWAHLSTTLMVDDNRLRPEFSAQSLVNFGLAAATARWGWWSLLSHVFAPRSRALDILVQYYPKCYEHHHLIPRPANMELDTMVNSPPPRLRVLKDPFAL